MCFPKKHHWTQVDGKRYISVVPNGKQEDKSFLYPKPSWTVAGTSGERQTTWTVQIGRDNATVIRDQYRCLGFSETGIVYVVVVVKVPVGRNVSRAVRKV